MRKLFGLIVCVALSLIWSFAWAVGTVTISPNSIIPGKVEQIIFTCTGDAAAGTIPDTAISQENLAKVVGMYLHSVTAYPTSGGTAPDAADVFILTANNEDLLGSTDNTTAANGANLIHATLQKTALPMAGLIVANYYPVITGLLTLKVSNQATVSANWIIVLTFVR